MAAFSAMGLRSTVQRAAIAEWLAVASASGRDFSAEEAWQELCGSGARVGRATVFRALDALVAQGLIDRVEVASGQRRYRVCGADAHHHHIVCVDCGKVADVEGCFGSDFEGRITSETGYVLERHSLELFGRCAGCS